MKTRALYNQTLDQRWHSISSMLGLIAFEVTVLLGVMGLVREREMGTLEQIAITPMRRLELIAGKAVVPLVVGLFAFVVMFLIAQAVFGLPMRGSFGLLFGLTVVYLLTECSYSLLLSAVSRTQQQAVTMVFVWLILALVGRLRAIHG